MSNSRLFKMIISISRDIICQTHVSLTRFGLLRPRQKIFWVLISIFWMVQTKTSINWKILLFLRPRLVKTMRPRLYPESSWSLCCHATHYREIWIVWFCVLGGQVIQIPTTILAQASALQSVVVRQSTGNNNQGVLLRGGDTLWMSLNTLAVFR